MLIFDASSKQMDVVPAAFDGPSPRDKAALVACGGNLLLFGGFGPMALDAMEPADGSDSDEQDSEDPGMDPAKFTWFNDLWVFNIAQRSWRQVQVQSAPPARAAHSMCLEQGRLWLFGGKSATGRVGDLWSLPVAEALNPTPTTAWTLLSPSGVAPSGRSFAVLVTAPGQSGRLVLWGGMDNADARLADLHVYDPELNAWAQPSHVADPPADFLGAGVVHGNSLVLLGGPVFASASLAPVVSAKLSLPPPPEQQN